MIILGYIIGGILGVIVSIVIFHFDKVIEIIRKWLKQL